MFGERLKSLRNQANKTQQQVADFLGITRAAYSHFENGRNEPDQETIVKLADYFDVSTDYLLGRKEKPHYYDLTEKDERNIEKELEAMINDLSDGGALAFSKEDGEMSEETRELLIASLENSLRFARIEAKKKFTPKKYRD